MACDVVVDSILLLLSAIYGIVSILGAFLVDVIWLKYWNIV